MLFLDYIMARLGYTRITPEVIRLSMYQETFFTNLAKDVAKQPESISALAVLEPYHLNQIAITKFLRCNQQSVNMVQG